MGKFQVAEFAKKLPLGAHLVQVEHRFYGGSTPFEELTKENLKYLEPEQALNDFAAVQKYIQSNHELTGPWIVLGTSYGGNLAALYRSQFPELAVGAIAYSQVLLLMASPVWNPNFTSGSRERFAGKTLSKICFSEIKKAVTELETRFEKNDLMELKLIAGVENEHDIDFLEALSDATLGATLFNSQGICFRMKKNNQKEDQATKYVKAVVEYLKTELGSTLRDFSFSIGGRIRKQSSVGNSGSFGVRQFAYQHCRSLNQPFVSASSERQDSIVPIHVNLEYQKKFCYEEFGIANAFGEKQMGDSYIRSFLSLKSSGIAFLNGERDQWFPGSIGSIDQKFKPLLSTSNLYLSLKDGFHGTTLYASSPSMTPEESKVRAEVFEFVKKLLAGAIGPIPHK